MIRQYGPARQPNATLSRCGLVLGLACRPKWKKTAIIDEWKFFKISNLIGCGGWI